MQPNKLADSQQFSIVVLGAGLVGRFVALLLNELNQQLPEDQKILVSLHERDRLNSPGVTAKVAAAMLAPTAESAFSSESLSLAGSDGLSFWPRLLALFDAEKYFHQQGSVALAFRQDMAELNRFEQLVKPQLQKNLSVLSEAELKQLEPEINAQMCRALFIKEEGHIDNSELLKHLERKIIKSDIQIHEQSTIVIANWQANQNELVIDCRGFGAKNDLPTNQADFTESSNKPKLRGVRGEAIRVFAPEVRLNRPIRLMHPRYALYIVPKPDHRYVIGATEIESESLHSMTARSALELLSAAYSVHSGFAEAQIEAMDVGLRPTFDHNEPMVWQSDSFFAINGLYRHGYLLLPEVLQKLWPLIIKQLSNNNNGRRLNNLHNLNQLISQRLSTRS